MSDWFGRRTATLELRAAHARELASKDREIARLWALVSDLQEQLRPPKPLMIAGKPRDPDEQTPESAGAYEETGYPAL